MNDPNTEFPPPVVLTAISVIVALLVVAMVGAVILLVGMDLL